MGALGERQGRSQGVGWYVRALGAVATTRSGGPASVILPGVPYVVTGAKDGRGGDRRSVAWSR